MSGIIKKATGRTRSEAYASNALEGSSPAEREKLELSPPSSSDLAAHSSECSAERFAPSTILKSTLESQSLMAPHESAMSRTTADDFMDDDENDSELWDPAGFVELPRGIKVGSNKAFFKFLDDLPRRSHQT